MLDPITIAFALGSNPSRACYIPDEVVDAMELFPSYCFPCNAIVTDFGILCRMKNGLVDGTIRSPNVALVLMDIPILGAIPAQVQLGELTFMQASESTPVQGFPDMSVQFGDRRIKDIGEHRR